MTLAGSQSRLFFSNGPALLPHISPPLAHFARRSGWEQTFSELEPPLPPPFCACGERSFCGGWKWPEITRETAAFHTRGPPCVVPQPPSAVSMW